MHKDTKLQDFNTMLRNFKTVLKQKSNQTGQLHKLIQTNFTTYYQAQRMIQYVSKSLEQANYYNSKLAELSESLDIVKTEANMQVISLKRVFRSLKSQQQAEVSRHNVQKLLLVSNDIIMYLSNPLLFASDTKAMLLRDQSEHQLMKK